jgi:hypothetical protein
MTRLILTTDDSGAGSLKQTGLADIVIPFGLRFVWGPLWSEAEFATWLAARSTSPGSRWLDNLDPRHFGATGTDIGFVDFCERCETIELWIDPEPNAQLTLVWLLDYLRPHRKVVSKLRLVQADTRIGEHTPNQVIAWHLPSIEIGSDLLQTAGTAWRAFRAPTPQAWFDLLSTDLSMLPQLRQTVVTLLEELPERSAGLGATETRMLELIADKADAGPFDLFPGKGKRNQRRAFGYWEVGSLLDGLAHCPVPAVNGLAEGPFTLAMHEDRSRHARYSQSRSSLTHLGEAVLARTEDFSRHNPIHRWWGGTELTNGNLWRWDLANRALIAP